MGKLGKDTSWAEDINPDEDEIKIKAFPEFRESENWHFTGGDSMTVEEKSKFITDLMDNAKYEILKKVDKMPENWNGIEIREYITDYVSENVRLRPMGRRRLLRYRNDIITKGI